MRIVGGNLRGKKILDPVDKSTRPLKDIVRESIFNILKHSKNESVKLISKSEKINGKDPKIAMVIHESAVKRKAWDKFSFLSWSILDKKNNMPKIIDIIDPLTKEASSSLNMNCIIIGIIINTPKIICKIPNVKKTVL